MRKLLACVAAALLLPLSACGSPQGESTHTTDLPSCANNAMACEVTITYKGKPLDCVLTYDNHGNKYLACDFVKYHKEND